jgi:hypothetical protein
MRLLKWSLVFVGLVYVVLGSVKLISAASPGELGCVYLTEARSFPRMGDG